MWLTKRIFTVVSRTVCQKICLTSRIPNKETALQLTEWKAALNGKGQ